MRFLIVDEDDFVVEEAVALAEQEIIVSVIGIVSKNWHVYGTVSSDRIADTIAKHYDTTRIFEGPNFKAIFINWSDPRSDDPEANEVRALKWLDWAYHAGANLARSKLLTISQYPSTSKIVRIGKTAGDMVRMMSELSRFAKRNRFSI